MRATFRLARRKRIYTKLGVSGAGELISALLALSLRMLAKSERIERQPIASTEPDQGVVTAPAMHVRSGGVARWSVADSAL
jgi:hypothetical protein